MPIYSYIQHIIKILDRFCFKIHSQMPPLDSLKRRGSKDKKEKHLILEILGFTNATTTVVFIGVYS